MNPEPRQLTPDEELYANLVIGADTVSGGNVGVAEPGSRLIADQYPLGRVELPPAYYGDEAEKLRSAHGAKPELQKEVRTYIDQYGLLDARAQLAAEFKDADRLRIMFMNNMGGCIEEMAKLALAKANGDPLPPFEARWEASTGKAPELTDMSLLHTELRDALSQVGIEVGKKESLREALERWEHKVGIVPKKHFATLLKAELGRLLVLARENLFGPALADSGIDIDSVPFDGNKITTFDKPDSHASGSSLYIGGLTADGRPAMQANLHLNSGHPSTRPGLTHLAAHEGIPGHYVDAVLSDLMWIQGRVGFEAVTSTMCSREVALKEGWAQNTLAALFGGEEAAVEALGPDFLVELVAQRILDAAKNDGVILLQRDHTDKDDVSRILTEKYLLSPMLVRKIHGWAGHDLIGSMYAGSYQRGARSVRKAIQEHGAKRVAELCFHQNGYHDISTFEAALEEKPMQSGF